MRFKKIAVDPECTRINYAKITKQDLKYLLKKSYLESLEAAGTNKLPEAIHLMVAMSKFYEHLRGHLEENILGRLQISGLSADNFHSRVAALKETIRQPDFPLELGYYLAACIEAIENSGKDLFHMVHEEKSEKTASKPEDDLGGVDFNLNSFNLDIKKGDESEAQGLAYRGYAYEHGFRYVISDIIDFSDNALRATLAF